MSRIRDELIEAALGVVAVVLFALIVAVALITTAQGQNIENQPIASQYSTWQVVGYAPDTYSFVPTTCRVQGGGSFFPAFAVGTPVTIVDGNPSLTEIVAPSNVTINNNTCSIAIAPANHHNLPFSLTSATGGLQEAINANIAEPAINTIILDNKFYQAVGPSKVAAVIDAAIGYNNLGLVDITQTPYVWYHWNGSHYVVAPTGGDVTSVFGRQGAVVAETGDYDCAQVTDCLSSAPVTSVFGRTGAVTAQTGDYTCPQVTNCDTSPNSYLTTTLLAGISSTATTIPLTSVAGLTNAGEIVIGSEWISYTGISGNNLTGATRGVHLTAPAAYSSGADVFSVIVDFTNPSQAAQNYIATSTGTYRSVTTIGCSSPDELNEAVLQVGCPGGNETYIDADGGIEQTNGTDRNVFQSEVGIGPGGGKAFIADSGNLFDATRQNQAIVPQGFGAGLAGPVESIQPFTIAAPTIQNFAQPTGTTTWSYECTGTDVDGNTFPGTIASITNGPTTITAGEIVVTCPFSAGAYSQTIWRLAGGPNQGSLITLAQPANIEDEGIAATAGTPTSVNSSVPKVCVAGEQFCEISGATSTPTVPCASGTQGWISHNVSATTSPFAYVCNGSAWVTAY